MVAGVAMGGVDFPTMMSKTVLYTMSQAWQLGRAVLRARRLHSSVLAAITDQQEGFVLICGKVCRYVGTTIRVQSIRKLYQLQFSLRVTGKKKRIFFFQ